MSRILHHSPLCLRFSCPFSWLVPPLQPCLPGHLYLHFSSFCSSLLAWLLLQTLRLPLPLLQAEITSNYHLPDAGIKLQFGHWKRPSKCCSLQPSNNTAHLSYHDTSMKEPSAEVAKHTSDTLCFRGFGRCSLPGLLCCWYGSLSLAVSCLLLCCFWLLSGLSFEFLKCRHKCCCATPHLHVLYLVSF